MTVMLEITCRDPIVSRDGRPFGAGQGNRMRSLDWPLPSVLAGSLRSTLGKSANKIFRSKQRRICFGRDCRPAATGGRTTPLPFPRGLRRRSATKTASAVPQAAGDGCDSPRRAFSLCKSRLPTIQPEAAPAWWPQDRYAAWLAGEEIAFDQKFLRAAEADIGLTSGSIPMPARRPTKTSLLRLRWRSVIRADMELWASFPSLSPPGFAPPTGAAKQSRISIRFTRSAASAVWLTGRQPQGRLLELPGENPQGADGDVARAHGAGDAGDLQGWLEARMAER